MKLQYPLILTALISSLVACNSGSSGNSNVPPNDPGSVTSVWTNVGQQAPNFTNLDLTYLTYDKASHSFFGMELDGDHLCSISAMASETDTWNCNISLPAGYQAIYSVKNLFSNNNGDLFVYALQDPITSTDTYVLKYNIESGQWDAALKIIDANGEGVLGSAPRGSVYQDNTLIGRESDSNLAQINLDTGVMTIESDFYIPKTHNEQQAINRSNLYYPAYAPTTYKQYIYTKDFISESSATQFGAEFPVDGAISIKGLSTDNTTFYVCTPNHIYSMGLNATTVTPWDEQPPTSIYTESINGEQLHTSSTGCEELVSVDGRLFAYAQVYELNQNQLGIRMQLLKYKIK